MEKVIVEIQIEKDGKEVVDLIDGILEKVLKKAPMAEYTELFDELSAAVDGAQNAIAGLKDESRATLVGYMVTVLMNRLAPIKAEGPATETPTDPA